MSGVTSSMTRLGGSIALLLVGIGCGGGGFDPSLYPTPESLMEAAVGFFEAGNCGRAETALTQLTFELPARDPRHAEVRFYLAECRFRDSDYLEATRQYRRVADNFPQHAFAARALLRAGQSYARLWRRAELDPTYGESARSTILELLNRYPDSEAAREAQPLVVGLNEKFAKKEFRTGQYYMRLKAYDSAIISFKEIVANYSNTSFAPRAVSRLIEAYDRIGYEEEKRDMCDYLGRYHPDVDRGALPCGTAAASP